MIYFLESYYVLNNGWKKTTKKSNIQKNNCTTPTAIPALLKKRTVVFNQIFSAFKCIVKILESFLLRNKCFVKV